MALLCVEIGQFRVVFHESTVHDKHLERLSEEVRLDKDRLCRNTGLLEHREESVVFFFVETDGVAEHRRIILGVPPPFLLSFFCHITLDLVVSRHKPPLSTSRPEVLKGCPTSERQPAPCKGKCFSGCSNLFERLKRHLAVFRWTQKSDSDLQVHRYAVSRHVTISVYKHINKLTGQLAKCSRSCLFGGCLGIIMWIRKLWVFVSSFPYFRPPTFLCVFRSLRYVPVSRCSHNAGIRGCKVFRGNTTRIMRCGDFSGNRRLDLVFP